jgi:hypothetical protein
MPARQPISDEELAGLIMAVTAEAGGAGWNCRYTVDNGRLVLLLAHPAKQFATVTADNGSRRLIITAGEETK